MIASVSVPCSIVYTIVLRAPRENILVRISFYNPDAAAMKDVLLSLQIAIASCI